MYDFSNAIKTFNETGSKETKTTTKYPLIYPLEGKLMFRPLYNPKSSQFYRLINRHKIEGKTVNCLATYEGKKDNCPVCKMLKNIENSGIKVPMEYNSKVRAIMFAQFVGADYEVANGKITAGDIFLLMVPYTIYNQYHKWLADYMDGNGSGLEKLTTSTEGPVCIIEKGKEANDWQFRQHPTKTYEYKETVEEWVQVLNNIDDLYEQCNCHNSLTQAEMDTLNTFAIALNDAFLGSDRSKLSELTTTKATEPKAVEPSPVTQSVPNLATAVETQLAAESKPVVTQATPAANSYMPSCYGNYTPENSTNIAMAKRCKFCPQNMTCKTVSSSVPF